MSFGSIGSSQLINASQGDIYSSTLDLTKQYFEVIGAITKGLETGEPITLSDGTVVDPNSLAGMAVITSKLQLVNADLEWVTSVMNFFKTMEKSLQSGISA